MTEDIEPAEEVKFVENNIRKFLKEKDLSAIDVLTITMACFKGIMHVMKPNDFMEKFKENGWDKEKVFLILEALMFLGNMVHICSSPETKENGN
jgi:hypothetical protein